MSRERSLSRSRTPPSLESDKETSSAKSSDLAATVNERIGSLPDHTSFMDIPRGGSFGAPSLGEFEEVWKLWDAVTLGMIPKGMLLQKPIDLRHICLFYLGHIPAFLDIHLSRLFKEPHTEPEYFKDIFERGIDPHVDDPTQIHPHSEVPVNEEDWPALEEILGFRDRVRDRLRGVYASIARGDERIIKVGRKIDRVLWMLLEHEGWHAETLLYMLIQRSGTPGGTVPPSGFAPPLWLSHPSTHTPSSLKSSTSSKDRPALEDLIKIEAQTFTIGHDDHEEEDTSTAVLQDHDDYEFGWDNEHPRREAVIEKDVWFEKTCISNEQYKAYLDTLPGEKDIPTSWVLDGKEVKVRSLYGPVSFEIAGNWPLVASYDELAAFAHWKGGRVPNEFELRRFIDEHLDAESSTVGFKEWTFTDPVKPDPARGLRGHNGGVWEVTSSNFDHYEGFKPSILYPGYSSDFFDGLHNVVLGGSFATIPRIAQRRTVRNYYQAKYPYAWTGARVVYDTQ